MRLAHLTAHTAFIMLLDFNRAMSQDGQSGGLKEVTCSYEGGKKPQNKTPGNTPPVLERTSKRARDFRFQNSHVVVFNVIGHVLMAD